jgi:hypothetical protein
MISKATAITPATLTRPITVNVPATAPVLEKKPEEAEFVAVEEGVMVAEVKAATDEEKSGLDRPAVVAKDVGVEDEEGCCATSAGAVEVDEVDV